MSPPTSLSACPPAIREHPLPGDRCTAPSAPNYPPTRTFRRLSVALDFGGSFRSGVAGNGYTIFRNGINGIFRPHPNLNLGLSFDTDYGSELTLMGRVGAYLPFHPMRMYGLELTGMAGLRQIFNQPNMVGGADAPVSGSLFAFGAEATFRVQMLQEFSLVPYFRFLASPPADVDLGGGGRTSLPWGWEMQFGLGFSFDFLPASN